MTSTIDHAEHAQVLLDASSILSAGNPGLLPVITEALAHATLAVAEQAKIANLIAYVVKLSSHPTDVDKLHSADVEAFRVLTRAIREGLDL